MGYIVGISEHCGHALTWKVLTCDTNRVISRSIIRPFDTANINLRADSLGGEMRGIIKSRNEYTDNTNDSNQISTSIDERLDSNLDNDTQKYQMAIVNPED